MKKLLILALLLALATGFAAQPDTASMRLSEKNLLLRSENGQHCLTPKTSNITFRTRDSLLDLSLSGSGEASADLPLKKEWKYLMIELEMQTGNVIPGKKFWQNAGLSLCFLDAKGKRVGNWPRVIRKTGTADWQFFHQIYSIPEGAVKLSFAVGNWGTGGKLDIRNLAVTPLITREMRPGRPFDPKELWSFHDAERIITPTRERICLNGLWQFEPATPEKTARPAQFRYYFKVPGVWPGFDGWSEPGSGQRILNPDRTDSKLNGKEISHAWYRRTIAVPENWKGRRILLDLSYPQVLTQIFIDGKNAGSIHFPGGTLDLTSKIRPGSTHDLSILLTAQPSGLKAASYSDINRLHIKDKKIIRRGLLGDVYLRAEPENARIGDLHAITSVADKTITFDLGFQGTPPPDSTLEIQIQEQGKTIKLFRSGRITLNNRRFQFTSPWTDPKLWDTEHPENLYTAVAALKDGSGKTIDVLYPEEFGFREFSIKGRDFFLNGKAIRLQITPSLFPMYGAGPNIPENFRRNAELMHRYGINFCYALNYDFSPGEVCYQDTFYREYSKNGILTALTLPNPVFYEFQKQEQIQDYTKCTEYLIRRFQNVPGIVMYASTHNSSGWGDSDNPVRLGSGIHGTWAWRPRNNVIAKQADQIVHRLDSSRPHYRHSSGISGNPVITLNCYLNWMPIQERRDYLELWSKYSKLPLIFVEYGIPHLPSWSSYRGPAFIWSGPQVMSIWLNEYIAPYLGEKAYILDGVQKHFLNSQAAMFGNKKVSFGRYNWFLQSPAVAGVQARMLGETIPYFRGHGLSGLAFWDHYAFWRVMDVPQILNENRFKNLKRTGMTPDYIHLRQLDYGNGESVIGSAVREAYRPLLGRITGKIGNFTEHNAYFLRGESVQKSLMLLNDTMHREEIRYTWEIPGLGRKGSGSVSLDGGERKFIPIDFQLPGNAPEHLSLKATFLFSDGWTEDSFDFAVGNRRTAKLQTPLYCFDPEGSAGKLLSTLGLTIRNGKPAPGEILIIGRNALEKYPGDLGAIAKSGVKLLILEQSHSTLWNRLGIRSTEYGLRKLFSLSPEFLGKPLENWRGASTLKAPYERRSEWLGIPVSGNIQAGYRGAVATVLPEKPCVGDWMPILHGGFNLSYAPLLMFKEGKAEILFSQLDLSGRTEPSPEAVELFASALEFLERSPAKKSRRTFYSGGPEGKALLDTLKIKYETGSGYGAEDLLIVAPGFSPEGCREAVARGTDLLGIGLDKNAIDRLVPGKNGAGIWKHTYSYFAEGLMENSFFRGVSNSDLFWRKPLTSTFFDGGCGPALKHFKHGKGNMVFIQIAPWMFEKEEFQLRITRRRNFALISRIAHNMGAEAESGLLKNLTSSNKIVLKDWFGKADPEKKGYRELGSKYNSSWRKVKVATNFDSEANRLEGYDGDFFYRTVFDLPDLPKRDIQLYLGRIDDCSWVWLNGTFLGEISDKTHPENYWLVERKYTLSPRLLKKKGNTLIVLCRDLRGNGGILGTPRLILGSSEINLYADTPDIQDDPYRYFHW